MQKSGEAVPEIEPMEKANFEQRIIHESIQITLIREEAGVEPHLVSTLNAVTDEVHLRIEPSKLRHPDVAMVSKFILHLRRIDRVHRKHARQISVDEFSDASILRRLRAVRLIENVLKIN